MLKILIAIFVLTAAFLLRGALIPMVIGVGIAAVLDPYVDWLAARLGLSLIHISPLAKAGCAGCAAAARRESAETGRTRKGPAASQIHEAAGPLAVKM